MGAWGTGVFENDSALDWLEEFNEDKNFNAIFSAYLEASKNTEGLIDEEAATGALVAIEIILGFLNCPNKELPENIRSWIKRKKFPDKKAIQLFNKVFSLIDLDEEAQKVWDDYSIDEKWNFILKHLRNWSLDLLTVIKEKSEIAELWKESNDYSSWLDEISSIKKRLQDCVVL